MAKVIGVLLILLFIGFIVFEVRGFIIDCKKRKKLKEQKSVPESPEVSEVTIADFENSDTNSDSKSDTVNKKKGVQ